MVGTECDVGSIGSACCWRELSGGTAGVELYGYVVCVHACYVHRVGSDYTCFAASAYSVDVVDQRDFSDCCGGLDCDYRRQSSSLYHRVGGDRSFCIDDQHRQRILDYGSHVEDVQEAGAEKMINVHWIHLGYLVA